MIIVTGGAGMIGSNIVKGLNESGINKIIIVDDLKDGRKFKNICDLDFEDYIDFEDFISLVKNNSDLGNVKVIFHQGACSKTTEWDGKYLMSNNYEYSKILFKWSQVINAQFIYASSASVYGFGKNGFKENIECENPINPYAFSKFMFDRYLRNILKNRNTNDHNQIVSLRYFNVYGPRENHKDNMASTIFHFHNQIKNNNVCRLFKGYDGYKDGEQKRDFVYVEDCVNVNLWFMNNPFKSGIFNIGTGNAETFNTVSKNILEWHRKNKKTDPSVIYIPFPEELKGSYQNFTKADITKLRKIGYSRNFYSIKEGINKYISWLEK